MYELKEQDEKGDEEAQNRTVWWQRSGSGEPADFFA